MIILRRMLAVLLGCVFIVVTIATLVIWRLDDTVANADFYVKHLAEGDLYNFIYDDLAELAVQEVREEVDDPVVDLARLDRDIVDAIRGTFPPEWLQEQTERVLREIVPYVVGKEREFAITLPIDDRIRAGGASIKRVLRAGQLTQVLYDDPITDVIDDALRDATIPFGLEFTTAELVESVRRIAPPDWISDQVDQGIDALIPYIVGDTDEFVIVISIADRADIVAQEIKALLATKDLRGFVLEEVVDPLVLEEIGADFRVPFNLVVDSGDVQRVVRDAITDEWLQRRIDELVDATVDFMAGRSDTFAVVVPLGERKPFALDAIGRLMDRKLAEAYSSARPCRTDELPGLSIDDMVRDGITCRIPGVTVDDLKSQADLDDYDAEVARLVGRALPDAFTFSEADLRAAFGPGQSGQLDDVREWVTEGFTVTQADLEEEVAKAQYDNDFADPWSGLTADQQQDFIRRSSWVEDLNEARHRINGGFVYTQVDFLDDLDDLDESARDNFLDGRSALKWAFGWRVLGWVIAPLLLIAVGLLGGRRLYSKLAWGAVFLLIVGLAVWIVSGPTWNTSGEDEIDRQFEEEIADLDRTELERTALRRTKVVVLGAADDFASGLAGQGLILFIVGAVAFAGSIAGPPLGRAVAESGRRRDDEIVVVHGDVLDDEHDEEVEEGEIVEGEVTEAATFEIAPEDIEDAAEAATDELGEEDAATDEPGEEDTERSPETAEGETVDDDRDSGGLEPPEEDSDDLFRRRE